MEDHISLPRKPGPYPLQQHISTKTFKSSVPVGHLGRALELRSTWVDLEHLQRSPSVLRRGMEVVHGHLDVCVAGEFTEGGKINTGHGHRSLGT